MFGGLETARHECPVMFLGKRTVITELHMYHKVMEL